MTVLRHVRPSVCLILALFWLSETGQIWGFRAFPGERMEEMALNFTRWCILTIFRTDKFMARFCWFLLSWCYFDLVKWVKFEVSGHFLENAWKSLWPWSVDFSNFGDILTSWNGSNLPFSGISWRAHGGNGLKFCKLMYLEHLQNWLLYGFGLLIFLILALFWLSETGQRTLGFPGIFWKTHWGNGLKFCMLMYPDHSQ